MFIKTHNLFILAIANAGRPLQQQRKPTDYREARLVKVSLLFYTDRVSFLNHLAWRQGRPNTRHTSNVIYTHRYDATWFTRAPTCANWPFTRFSFWRKLGISDKNNAFLDLSEFISGAFANLFRETRLWRADVPSALSRTIRQHFRAAGSGRDHFPR